MKFLTEYTQEWVNVDPEDGVDTLGFGGWNHQFRCCGASDYVQSNNSNTGDTCFLCEQSMSEEYLNSSL